MAVVKSKLIQQFKSLFQAGEQPAYLLNKQVDTYSFAQSLFKAIEDKRSGITALTRQQATSLGQTNLQFSNAKHESRINTFYRLLGLPTEQDIGNQFSLLDESGNTITDNTVMVKDLVNREYEQLLLTFNQYLSANTPQQLNEQLNSFQATEQKLIAQLFDPNTIKTTRLFPIVQFSQVQNLVEPRNRICQSFATIEERYVNETITYPPFLETVITTRLLQQSGGTAINTQGAVETIALQTLAYSLANLSKTYNRNQAEAEKHLLDGIATIRPKPPEVNSSLVKAPDLNAGERQNDGITTAGDIQSNYRLDQIELYSAAVSLLPVETDVVPIATDINNTPFQSRGIKENALTSSFIDIINSNTDAMNRIIANSKKTLQKRQYRQDKLTAELGGIIGEIGGISLAEIIIVIAALWVMDEEDLVGLLSKARYDKITGATNSNTTTNSNAANSSGNTTTSTKQVNIYDILKQFKSTRTATPKAVQILQNIVQDIYKAFVVELGKAHILQTTNNAT